MKFLRREKGKKKMRIRGQPAGVGEHPDTMTSKRDHGGGAFSMIGGGANILGTTGHDDEASHFRRT